jgi:hypothetical protein
MPIAQFAASKRRRSGIDRHHFNTARESRTNVPSFFRLNPGMFFKRGVLFEP